MILQTIKTLENNYKEVTGKGNMTSFHRDRSIRHIYRENDRTGKKTKTAISRLKGDEEREKEREIERESKRYSIGK